MTVLGPVYEDAARGFTSLLGHRYPVAFGDPVAEHHAARRAAGLFDFAFMTHVAVAGRDALAVLQRVVVNDVARLAPGAVLYSPICDDDGGMVDDCTVIRRTDDWLVTTGLHPTADWLAGQARGRDVSLTDESALAVLAVQGPDAAARLAAIGVAEAAALDWFRARPVTWDGVPVLLARLGYSGEAGYELFLPAEAAPAAWRRLARVMPPCGGAALESLRVEAGYLLTGVDFDRSVTPYDAGLGHLVRLDKGDFVGRASLARAPRRGAGIVWLECELGALLRPDAAVEDARGRSVGRVTSGAPAPTLGGSAGIARVRDDARTPLRVDGVLVRCGRRPWYDPDRRRPRASPWRPPAQHLFEHTKPVGP